MPLPEVIDGENHERSIRVLRVSYPLTIENVAEQTCGIRLRYHFYKFRGDSSRTLAGVTNPEEIKFQTNMMYLPAGHYTLEKIGTQRVHVTIAVWIPTEIVFFNSI